MNKTIILISYLLVCICSYGQINENGFVFRLDGNYNETATSNVLQHVDVYNAKSKNGIVSLSAGYLCRNWLFGLGFEYNRNKTNAMGYHWGRTESVEGWNETSLNSYGGMLYTNYYLRIWNNLYFTPGFHIGYGNIKGDYLSHVVSLLPIPSDLTLVDSQEPVLTHSSYKDEMYSDYFYMQLAPELTWFFSNRFGLNVQMGGIVINVVDFDWKNSQKQINFNPALWKLGVVFKI